ncbi:MAG: hypothetical protein ACT4PM_08670 [Gemmatimonadales bacterium]
MGVSYRVDRPTGIMLLEDDGLFEFPEWERAVLAALEDPTARRRRFLSDRRHLKAPHSLGLIEEPAVQVRGFTELKAALAWLLPVSEELEVERLQGWVDEGKAKRDGCSDGARVPSAQRAIGIKSHRPSTVGLSSKKKDSVSCRAAIAGP